MTGPTAPSAPAGLAAAPAYLPVPVHVLPEPRVRRAQLAVLAARLTVRDQWLIAMVDEHRVLTSTQILALAFGARSTANRRLFQLTESLRVLDRFRPRTPLGSAPEHYVLGPSGALWLAAGQDVTLKQFGYHRHRVHQIAVSTHLRHAVGANSFFTALAAAGRHYPGRGQLSAWWSERRCLRWWKDLVRPDGYGRWSLPGPTGRSVEFFVEYDTGTESLPVVARKLPGYAKLAAETRISTPVLFYLPSAKREAEFHRRLAADPVKVPVATTSPDALRAAGIGHPGGTVWKPAGVRGPDRVALIDLDALTTRRPRPRSDPDAAPALIPGWNPPPPPLPPDESDPLPPDQEAPWAR
jgi:hypothetical protein